MLNLKHVVAYSFVALSCIKFVWSTVKTWPKCSSTHQNPSWIIQSQVSYFSMQSEARTMEQILLVKTQNLDIIESSIRDCKFALYSTVPSNMCLYLTYKLLNTIDNRWLNNAKILRFERKNLFQCTCSTLQRKTRNLRFNDSWWILMCRWTFGPCFNSWSNKLDTRKSNKTISNYVFKLFSTDFDIGMRLECYTYIGYIDITNLFDVFGWGVLIVEDWSFLKL